MKAIQLDGLMSGGLVASIGWLRKEDDENKKIS